MTQGTDKIYLEEVLITTEDNTTMYAYKVSLVFEVNADGTTGNQKTIEQRHLSNCTGLAFAEGQLWLFDAYMDTTTNEMTQFEAKLNNTDYYSVVSKEQAQYAVIWQKDSAGNLLSIVHSGIVNSDGSYNAKDMAKGAQNYTNEDKFKEGHSTPPMNSTITHDVVYYKRN